MLVLLLLHHMLTSTPRPAMDGARIEPRSGPHSRACRNIVGPSDKSTQ